MPCPPSTWQGWHRLPANPHGMPLTLAAVTGTAAGAGWGTCHCGGWGVGGCGAVGGCGSDLVLQALMWKAALCRTRGGSATQLRKHHPGQRLCLYSILNRNQKKGGGGEGGNQVHFCLYILTKYIYLFTYEKAFFFFARQ